MAVNVSSSQQQQQCLNCPWLCMNNNRSIPQKNRQLSKKEYVGMSIAMTSESQDS